MKTTILSTILCLCLEACLAPVSRAQEPLDGPKRVFRDELLDNLVGTWMVTRTIRGKEVQNTLEAEWVLNHQFLEVHMKDVASPPTYEARVFIGYDNASERYVAHWIDVYGGRFSETLGYGLRNGDSILFVFEYPDGPFHNKLTWNATAKAWTFTMEGKNAAGKWTPFAQDSLRRTR
ncbi:MAG TPA: DUF1579 family protein [Blastocatellia bacterium]|nr:DUF1579 family protein [Blastocatellia bacterium]